MAPKTRDVSSKEKVQESPKRFFLFFKHIPMWRRVVAAAAQTASAAILILGTQNIAGQAGKTGRGDIILSNFGQNQLASLAFCIMLFA